MCACSHACRPASSLTLVEEGVGTQDPVGGPFQRPGQDSRGQEFTITMSTYQFSSISSQLCPPLNQDTVCTLVQPCRSGVDAHAVWDQHLCSLCNVDHLITCNATYSPCLVGPAGFLEPALGLATPVTISEFRTTVSDIGGECSNVHIYASQSLWFGLYVVTSISEFEDIGNIWVSTPYAVCLHLGVFPIL